MVQRNREDGLAKETYGIYTDGFKWIFMHVNRKYKVRPYSLVVMICLIYSVVLLSGVELE